ncbi:threonine--tRNA ligase [Candidatus Daviesbacteria bacterium]|nr:threonine--tRNA ligase [Candidatus Daviesbacteria bacterium]
MDDKQSLPFEDDKKLKDHKQIGQEMELFFTDEIAPGASFWLPKGMVIFKELEKYIRELTLDAGYLETSTPIMVKSELFKQSGHWEKFGEHNMYNLVLSEENDESKALSYSLKPMNCPESTILYRFRPRSYKELPLRLMEIGRLHRREKSGEVNGLLRVRQLTMDDAHIYAREGQIFDEVSNILDTMVEFYKKLGFEPEFRFATRPETRAGTDEMWDKAEETLSEAIKKKGIQAGDKKGDGAFYGPKIDLHIKDAQKREWQLATVQLDFHMPEAFDLRYINEEGQAQKPVMIHRAIFGSFERFIAILTEHFQGAFPLWLSPVQAQIIPISDKHINYAQKLLGQFKSPGIRVEIDGRAETMQSKIRDAQTQKIPYMIIVGDKEEQSGSISIRTRGGENLANQDMEQFLDKIKQEIAEKV